MDPIAKMKEAAREGWSTFAPFEMLTGSVAPDLVRFAGVQPGHAVLDVGCGTGVVALTAARAGANVTALDLSPALLERAQENIALARVSVDFHQGDVEALPFEDGAFDVVVSQFGHMFGPRPEITVAEMLRVLKPGGTIAFSTWPPELLTGKMFLLIGRYSPPPPEGVVSPALWGDPSVVRERLGSGVRDVEFDRSCMVFPTLSPGHMREFMEQNAGPVSKIVQVLTSEPDKLATFRTELEELIACYFRDNKTRQDFLISRAVKN